MLIVLKFYLSPGGFTCFEYSRACQDISDLGWELTWRWPPKTFDPDFKPTSTLTEKSVAAISQSELFIAMLPSNTNTQLEIGLAYVWCQEVALAARDAIYFTENNPACCHQSLLPGITRFVCSPQELSEHLRRHYLYLVAN